MKKIILALMVLAGAAMAEGFVVGTELTYGKVDSDISLTGPGGSASIGSDTKSIGFALKGGYEVESIRILGVITSERYKDDVIVIGEGSAVSIGVEADYIIDNMFVGAMVATGTKDFSGVDIDFTDVGARAGAMFPLSETAKLEAGIQYKQRGYDSYNYQGVEISLDEKIVGVFVGVSFGL